MSAASKDARPAPPQLLGLIAANARLWGAEAEIFSTYFASSERSAATDAAWLARQCFKEMVDGLVGRLGQLTGGETDFERTLTSAVAALADEVVRVELKHYVAFAIAYRISRREAGETAASARIGADWSENAELQSLRARHRLDYGPIGERAAAFTEGGYCTLYRAGIALAGRTARDAAIAAACAQVFEDELDHMLSGIAGLAEVPFSTREWTLLEKLTVEQGRCRIRMRNAQFGNPLRAARLRELEAGAAEPIAFDYARAGLRMP
jgi:hypothetical protein